MEIEFEDLWDDESTQDKPLEDPNEDKDKDKEEPNPDKNIDDKTTGDSDKTDDSDPDVDFTDPRETSSDPEKEEENKDKEGSDADGEPGLEGDPDQNGDLDKDKSPGDDEDPSTMERLLSQFDVIGGMVELEEGGSKHIDDMTPEEQDKVVKQLVDYQKEEATKQLVSEEEKEFLEGIRKNRSVEDILNDMADRKVMEMNINDTLGEPTDYENMEADQVFLKYLKEAQPDATESELQEDLTLAKEAKTYEDTVSILRNQYNQNQEQERQALLQKQQEDRDAQFAEEASKIVDAARSLDSVAGWKLNDEVKNNVLSNLVEKDAKGDSNFMREISSNPEKLFEAQWYLQYGQQMFDQMSEYYRDMANKQYKKGLQEGQSRKTTPKVAATRKKTEDSPAPESKVPNRKDNVADLDDLYN